MLVINIDIIVLSDETKKGTNKQLRQNRKGRQTNKQPFPHKQKKLVLAKIINIYPIYYYVYPHS